MQNYSSTNKNTCYGVCFHFKFNLQTQIIFFIIPHHHANWLYFFFFFFFFFFAFFFFFFFFFLLIFLIFYIIYINMYIQNMKITRTITRKTRTETYSLKGKHKPVYNRFTILKLYHLLVFS